MHWIYLIIAILFEVSGTTCMKISDGLTKLVPTLFIFFFYGGALPFFRQPSKRVNKREVPDCCCSWWWLDWVGVY